MFAHPKYIASYHSFYVIQGGFQAIYLECGAMLEDLVVLGQRLQPLLIEGPFVRKVRLFCELVENNNMFQ